MTEEDFKLLVDFHVNADRQGPGSDTETEKALSLTNLDFEKPLKVADIGCGSGAQTFALATVLEKTEITAVDLFNAFLMQLNLKAVQNNFDDRIITLKESMDQLSFDEGVFDLIWSEGAIYNIGFKKGLEDWKKYLKLGGYIAVSEITWLTNSRPKEIEEYWNAAYPEIDTASNKLGVIEELGYQPVGYFPLKQESWLDNYYGPIEDRFEAFLEENNHSEKAKNLVTQEKEEIKMYKQFKDYYSYGFYIAKKV
ncbi:class I SAM-dependent methyltransferase [Flammeovirga sp. EKP202]|uniref:class I SAM-dependent methyltransferase n=1 Tax=Flammeovirga sp. EKP202 TaxID=2770592 RepID=UPI00165F2C43|nr:class I SAM-dependent methyltransferase [Flammeovirga sp. EKP202]MBD0399864.1 class I SAM-dependent methyltransferase [Flammeovirga sp. EKP202]